MACIYIISPASVPDGEAIQKACDKAYRWMPIEGVEQLAQYQAQKGVVLLPGTLANLGTQVGLVRNYAPSMSAVIVVTPETIEQIASDVVQQSDVLVIPASPVEIAARLNQAMLLSELRHSINTNVQLDEVTGLYSYAYFLKRLGEEMSLSKRHQAPLVCVILSISFFDLFIDSYGYHFAAGLMTQVAQVIKGQVRSEDIVARLGDGEVGFLLPHSTEKGALSLTKRVVDKVGAMTFNVGDHQEQTELKAGIAGFPIPDEPDIDADTLIRYTRHALHHAKCSDDKAIQLFGAMKPVIG